MRPENSTIAPTADAPDVIVALPDTDLAVGVALSLIHI